MFLKDYVMQIETVEKMIVTIRDSRVIIDRDVAALYGVETKRVNEAVRNNPEKFPDGYVFQLSRDESKSLRSKFSTFTRFRDFTRTVSQIAVEGDEQHRKSLVARSGECLAEMLDNELAVSDVETVVELNLAMLKFRHVVKRRK